MRIALAGLVAVLSPAFAAVSFAQTPPAQFRIDSAHVGRTYDIEVVVPAAAPANGDTYPVAYCLDWHMLDDYLESLPGLMALGRLTEPYILVGISDGVSDADWASARTRDFTPARATDEYSKKYMYPGAEETAGGAKNFAAFLKEELFPRIERDYPADPSQRCLVGYSLGSLFGVYVLTEDPGMFRNYILGSPSLWFNEYYLGPVLAEQSADRFRHIDRMYISVGADESWEMLKSFDLVRTAMRRKDLDGLEMKAEIIGDAGHVGAMPIALYNGFRFVFKGE